MSQDAKISKTNNISIIKFSTKYEIQKKKAETPRDRPSAVKWQSAESLERAHGSLKEVTWWGVDVPARHQARSRGRACDGEYPGAIRRPAARGGKMSQQEIDAYGFYLRRYSGGECFLWHEYLFGALLSSHYEEDLKKLSLELKASNDNFEGIKRALPHIFV